MNKFDEVIIRVKPKHLLLDFDGVLTTNSVLVNELGEEFVVCSEAMVLV